MRLVAIARTRSDGRTIAAGGHHQRESTAQTIQRNHLARRQSDGIVKRPPQRALGNAQASGNRTHRGIRFE